MSLTHLYTCNYDHNEDIEHFYHARKLPFAPFFAINLSPQPWLQATTDVFFSDGLGVGERTTCFILMGKIQ